MGVRKAALSSLAMCGAITACSGSAEHDQPQAGIGSERTGSVGLRLQPVSGVTVSNVHYVVTRGPVTPSPSPAIVSEGNLPTPGTGSELSFGIPLPVGNGYYINLTGESTETGDDITCTGSYGPFAVAPNASAQIGMVLTCVDNTNGQLLGSVDVDTDACPKLIVDYVVAEGASAAIGASIQVHSKAHDRDNPTATIGYAWSVVSPALASVGEFMPANSASSTFYCRRNGDSVRIRVSASNGQCRKSLETVVSCFPVECGNGVVDTFETCDTALDPTCPADCTRLCGDGVVEGLETCDPVPANPASCVPPGQPGECTIRGCECGDGVVCGGEACDGNLGPGGIALPPGIFCNASCSAAISDSLCGDGRVGTFEECDGGAAASPSNPTVVTTRTCSANCETIASEECVACEQQGDCFASSDNCLGPAVAPFSLAQQRQCTDIMQCIQDSGCLFGASSLAKCYCGTLSAAACAAAPFPLAAPGAPNGPCAAIMQQGNPQATSNAAILSGLTNKSRPTGAAGQRLYCQKVDPLCAPVCGLQ